MIKVQSYDSLRRKMMKDPGFKKAYDRLGPEFELLGIILKKRKKDGLTQAKLAKRMGTKQSAISRFESGKANPTLDFLYRLADALGAQMKVTIK